MVTEHPQTHVPFRDSVGIPPAAPLGMITRAMEESRLVAKNLPEILVPADTYNVSPEPVILLAHLSGALALCLHDESRGVGGLLHLRFTSGDGRPSDVTDNTLSSVLVVLDRFKKAVLGNNPRPDEVQARVLAHALPPTGNAEPSASIVDLIQADFADGKIHCGSQIVRRAEGLCVCFEPFQGRLWVAGPHDKRHAAQKKTA